jgi:hypothetical protein
MLNYCQQKEKAHYLHTDVFKERKIMTKVCDKCFK